MPYTIDQILTALDDAADFEEVGSLAKARAFVTAAKRFLIYTPQSQSDSGSSLSMSVQQVENLLKRAQEYVAVNDATTGNASVRHISIGSFFR